VPPGRARRALRRCTRGGGDLARLAHARHGRDDEGVGDFCGAERDEQVARGEARPVGARCGHDDRLAAREPQHLHAPRGLLTPRRPARDPRFREGGLVQGGAHGRVEDRVGGGRRERVKHAVEQQHVAVLVESAREREAREPAGVLEQPRARLADQRLVARWQRLQEGAEAGRRERLRARGARERAPPTAGTARWSGARTERGGGRASGGVSN
jgi:hypothetical protein